MNAKMPALRKCFEGAGFKDVRTLLSSGNVVFSAPRASEATLQRKIERAMQESLDRTFLTIVRPTRALSQLLESDPYTKFKLRPGSKRVVTFLREAPTARLKLPLELHDARILAVVGREILSAYVPGPRGPVFMQLIEKTFGQQVTTRTWDTVRKVAAA
jgi:uncharacterized protein (DUF1697 family)